MTTIDTRSTIAGCCCHGEYEAWELHINCLNDENLRGWYPEYYEVADKVARDFRPTLLGEDFGDTDELRDI